MEQFVGSIAFIAGLLIAIIVGAIVPFVQVSGIETLTPATLAVLGLIVGLLNIGQKERLRFLVAAIAFMTMWGFGRGIIEAQGNSTLDALGIVVYNVIKNLVAFVAPAAFIVALLEVYDLGKSVEGLPEELKEVKKIRKKK